ncbi:hypothetical protein MASR2M79_18970 [Aminivibrio sp.]
MLADMENFGWKGLAYGERGFRNLTNSKRPVNTPADMEGLKIRLMQNPVYVDSFKALGANAVPMAWTEALTALQQGTIDGQENPLNVIVSFNLFGQKHLALTRHAYAPAPIAVSKRPGKSSPPNSRSSFRNHPRRRRSITGNTTTPRRPNGFSFSRTRGWRSPPLISLLSEGCAPGL